MKKIINAIINFFEGSVITPQEMKDKGWITLSSNQ